MADTGTAPDWISYLGSTIFGGGGVAAFFLSRKQSLNDTVDSRIKLILDDHQATREKDRAIIEQMEKKIQLLESEIDELRQKLGMADRALTETA